MPAFAAAFPDAATFTLNIFGNARRSALFLYRL